MRIKALAGFSPAAYMCFYLWERELASARFDETGFENPQKQETMHFCCCPGNNNDMWKKHKITFEAMLWWHWCCLHITAQSFSETQSAFKAFAMLSTVWISTAECILSESIGSKIWQELKLQFTWIKVTVRIYEVVRWENSYVVPHWGSQKYGDEISRYGMNCKILVLL